MKLFFQNIAPFDARMDFDFNRLNLIYYPNNQLAKAIEFAIQLMGEGDAFHGPNIPLNHKAVAKFKVHALDANKPIIVGSSRLHEFGSIQTYFEYTWDESLHQAICSDYKLYYNDQLMYHRANWEAHLHLDGLQAYVAARNEVIQMQEEEEEEDQSEFSYIDSVNQNLFDALVNMDVRHYSTHIQEGDPQNTNVHHGYPPDRFWFFKEEKDKELNEDIDYVIGQVAFDIPNCSNNHWEHFNQRHALNFFDNSKEQESYLQYNYIYPEVKGYINQLCSLMEIPIPTPEHFYDQTGMFIQTNLIVLDSQGVKRNILNLSTAYQNLYYWLLQMSSFGYWTYSHPTYFQRDRYVNLSGLERAMPSTLFYPLLTALKSVFKDFHFILSANEALDAHLFANYVKDQSIADSDVRIYHAKSEAVTISLKQITLDKDYKQRLVDFPVYLNFP